MSGSLTIVMYHYVRDLARSRYPEIKALDLALFREQLAFIRKHYEVITAEALMAAAEAGNAGGHWELPSNACLLTFDDGYADHFQCVFPLLDEYKLQGSFFPPARAISERKLLDVNKVHYILASVRDKRVIVQEIFNALDAVRAERSERSEHLLDSNEAFYKAQGQPSRFDTADVMFIKNMLQVALPPSVREALTTELFQNHVSADEPAFGEELYLSRDQLRCMARHGMYIGSHGFNHSWLGRMSEAEQVVEIDRSMEFLASVGTSLEKWIMCYPYGDANQTTLRLLRERNCVVGLTTEVAVATEDREPLLLPRLDTNDLPKKADAPMKVWAAPQA